MNIAPVANQREDQQQNRDHQQAGGLRRVDRAAATLAIIFWSGLGHANIVALGGRGAVMRNSLATTGDS